METRNFIYMLPIENWQKRFGVYHAAEIAFVFHFMMLPGLNEKDRALSDQMAGYWARFARTGDPNGDGAAKWPAYSLPEENYLVFNEKISVGQGYKADHCDCIDEAEAMVA
jgi:para-nitrobenzyl esterase